MTEKQYQEVISFINNFNHISPWELEEVLEYLNDKKYLSENGVIFKSKLWEMFIKKQGDKK